MCVDWPKAHSAALPLLMMAPTTEGVVVSVVSVPYPGVVASESGRHWRGRGVDANISAYSKGSDPFELDRPSYKPTSTRSGPPIGRWHIAPAAGSGDGLEASSAGMSHWPTSTGQARKVGSSASSITATAGCQEGGRCDCESAHREV